jgi:hypothetical protein
MTTMEEPVAHPDCDNPSPHRPHTLSSLDPCDGRTAPAAPPVAVVHELAAVDELAGLIDELIDTTRWRYPRDLTVTSLCDQLAELTVAIREATRAAAH